MRIALFRRSSDVFVEDAYSFRERRRRELARRDVWWRRHLAWIGRQPIPLRIVIVVAEIAAVYMAALVGLFIGLMLRALI